MRKWHIPYIVGMLLVMVVVKSIWVELGSPIEFYSLIFFAIGGFIVIGLPVALTLKHKEIKENLK